MDQLDSGGSGLYDRPTFFRLQKFLGHLWSGPNFFNFILNSSNCLVVSHLDRLVAGIKIPASKIYMLTIVSNSSIAFASTTSWLKTYSNEIIIIFEPK